MQQSYKQFVQLSILKPCNLHIFQLIKDCLQDMFLNMALIVWIFSFFNLWFYPSESCFIMTIKNAFDF